MKSKRNEDIFRDDLIVFDYLVHEYKKELKKTKIDSWNGKEYKATKKSRLHRLRLEIDKLLKHIEDDLPSQYIEEV